MPEKITEIALKAGRGAVGIVPGGSLVAEFFTTPKERRLNEYVEAIGSLIEKLEADHKLDSGTLSHRDDFLDVLYASVNMWLLNSNPEKHKAILALLENVAVQPCADGAKDLIILRLMRDLSGSHLYLVTKFGEDPNFNGTEEFSEMMGAERWNSDWGVVHNDLSRLGVIEPGGLSVLGRELLNRITPPCRTD